MKILGSSPAVVLDRVYPYENRYLFYLCRLIERVNSEDAAPQGWSPDRLLGGPRHEIGPLPFEPLSLDPAELEVRLTRHFWAALCESFTSAADGERRYVAEKTHGSTTETLARAGIPLKLANLVRDPRDIVTSVLAFDAKRGYYGFGRREHQPEDEYVAQLATQMKLNINRMSRRAADHDHMWVRYEDLVTNRDSAVKRLSEWLDIELDADAGRPDGPDYLRHSTTSTPNASVGNWREQLSHAHVVSIENVLAEEMSKLGYRPSHAERVRNWTRRLRRRPPGTPR